MQQSTQRLLILILMLILPFSLVPAQEGSHGQQSESHSHEDSDHDHEHGDHDHEHGDHDHDHEDGDHDHEHEHAHHHHSEGTEGSRLAVSSATDSSIRVFDLGSAELLSSFGTPGEKGRVYAAPAGDYAFVLHRDENRVTLLHSGLTLVDHGDHMDLIQGNPYVAATMNVGRQPTHFFAHGDDIAIFNDQDGTIAVLDQRLLGLTLDFTEIITAQPDHGAPAIYGDFVFSGHLALDRVDVYRRDGSFVSTIDEPCPRLHGENIAGNTIAFGCTDGVLVVEVDGDTISHRKIVNPANAAENARVGTVIAHDNSPVMIGNFGSGIAIIDPSADVLTSVDLPERPLSMSFAENGTRLVILTTDGDLHLLEPTSGEVLASLSLMSETAHEIAEGNVVRATMSVKGDYAYVTDPTAQSVHEIHLDDFEMGRSMQLDFIPFTVAVLSLPEGTIH